MRYGVLADVHGNLPALAAALAVLRGEHVDVILHAGDIVGYGPFPNECAAAVAEATAHGVAGNHELIVLGELPMDRCTRLARETLEWTRSVLGDTARTYLAGLPRRLSLDGLAVAHGSLDDPQEYVRTPERAERELAEIEEGFVLVLGHTHVAWAYPRGGDGARRRPTGPIRLDRSRRWLLNPGSVGQPRDRDVRARFAIVDPARREATFFAETYDIEPCRQELRRHGLPPDALVSPTSRLAPFARLARGAVRRVTGAPRGAAGE